MNDTYDNSIYGKLEIFFHISTPRMTLLGEIMERRKMRKVVLFSKFCAREEVYKYVTTLYDDNKELFNNHTVHAQFTPQAIDYSHHIDNIRNNT